MSPMIEPSTLNELARAWADTSIALTLKGSMVLAFFALAAISLRRGSAALRHLSWTTGVMGLLLVPVLSLALPAWQVAVLPAPEAPLKSTTQPGQSSPAGDFLLVSGPQTKLSPSRDNQTASIPFAAYANPTTTRSYEPARALESDTSITSSVMDYARQLNGWSWAFFVWETGMLSVLVLFGVGAFRLWWLRRNAVEVHYGSWRSQTDGLAEQLGIKQPIKLLKSPRAMTPMTWGYLQPVVLLPGSADEWSLSQRRDVLLHELAHVKRRDCLTQAFAQVACATNWFNPLVWIAAAQMRMERERACDDQVLLAGSKASSYASHLLEMARSLKSENCASLASVAMARRSHLSDRLVAVLDPEARRWAPNRLLLGAASALALFVAIPAATIMPVALDNTQTAQAAPPDNSRAPRVRYPVATVPSAPRAFAVRPTPAVPREPASQQTWTVPGLAEAPVAPLTVRWPRVVSGWAQDPGDEHTYILADPGQPLVFTPDSQSGPVVAQLFGRNSRSNTEFNGRSRWTINDGSQKLSIEVEGEIEFNDDLTDVVSMADDSYFEIEQRKRGRRYRVEIDVNRDGELERSFFVRGRREEWNEEAQEFMEEVLPEALLNMGVNADARMQKIYERDGLDGALREINRLDGDHARSAYYRALMGTEGLSDKERSQVLEEAARDIESDFERAQLLVNGMDQFMENDHMRTSLLEAVDQIDSDFERRRVLSSALNHDDLKGEHLLLLLESINDIDSDFERTQILTQIDPDLLDSEPLLDAYFLSVEQIDSDFETARALSELLSEHGDRPGMLARILDTMRSVDSDFESARILTGAAGYFVDDDELRELYFNAVDDLDSDFERARVLTKVLNHRDLSDASKMRVLESVYDINSDFEKARVLVELSRRGIEQEELREAYLRAAKSIDSDHEYGRVMRALR